MDREEADKMKRLEAENQALRELVAGLEKLLICYRVGKQPSESILDGIAKARETLAGRSVAP